MDSYKFCPNCGTQLESDIRFCFNCGFDTESSSDIPHNEYYDDYGYYGQPKKNNTTLIITLSLVLGFLVIFGSVFLVFKLKKTSDGKDSLFSMFKKEEILDEDKESPFKDPVEDEKSDLLIQDREETGTEEPDEEKSLGDDENLLQDLEDFLDEFPQENDSQNKDDNKSGSHGDMDLTRASTYLSTAGQKLSFYVNYVDGTSGIVERISGRASPNPQVLVTNVEIGVDMGEEYGFGFHYLERSDGTYYISDGVPYEIHLELEDNLFVGKTWSTYYYDYDGPAVEWEVLAMEESLELELGVFHNCLVIYEDNKAVDHQAITYYAPGFGAIYVISPHYSLEYYKLIEIDEISENEASEIIKKWCPNYLEIKDEGGW